MSITPYGSIMNTRDMFGMRHAGAWMLFLYRKELFMHHKQAANKTGKQASLPTLEKYNGAAGGCR